MQSTTTTTIIIAATAVCLGALPLRIALADKEGDDHKHDPKKEHEHEHAAKAGPNGGRLIHEVEPHAEFLVTEDRKVRITFVDDDNKVVAAGAQTVTVTCGDRQNPTRLSFLMDGNSLISDKVLPGGNDFPVVLQIRTDAKAKSVLEKFNLNLKDCPTCDFKEYACICGHEHGEEGEGHHDDDKDKDGKKDKD